MTASPAHRSIVPADGLLHPLALAALAVWALNDHVLKAAWPGSVTGKLSDVAGLLVFPLVIQAAVEVLCGRRVVASRAVLRAGIVATGMVFTAVQIVPAAGTAYEVVWGWLSWPLKAPPWSWPPGPVVLTQDPTDLLVLPTLAGAWWLGSRRADPDATPALAGTRTSPRAMPSPQ